jgi:GNAT superfamily N-acetyltransferase
MSKADPHLRPSNLPKDLSEIADLVELCFAETLDDDGRNFIRKMRQSARTPGLLGAPSRLSPSLTGYVWEEDGRVVGNFSLIPVVVGTRKSTLIANVAVHPDYRSRGIARKLTQAGLAMLRKKRIATAWLQVRDDNQIAVDLYTSFGFQEKARRTVWHSQTSLVETGLPEGYTITTRRRGDWKKQEAALKQLYPPQVRWNLPLDIAMFAPGLVGGVWRGLSEHRTEQWSLHRGGRWTGSLSWQSSYLQADWLWLAAPLEEREAAIRTLLPHAVRERGIRRTLAINHPAYEDTEALTAAGFQPHQTLIWMQAEIE